MVPIPWICNIFTTDFENFLWHFNDFFKENIYSYGTSKTLCTLKIELYTHLYALDRPRFEQFRFVKQIQFYCKKVNKKLTHI